MMQDLQAIRQRFKDDMWRIYYDAKRDVNNEDSIAYLRQLGNHRGEEIALAHDMIATNNPAFFEAIYRLTKKGRPDLTVEALVLRQEYAILFSEDERTTARWRLEDARRRVEAEQ